MTELEVHDSRRCPVCDTLGQVVAFDTRSGELADSFGRVRARTLECRDEDCNTRWKYFG